jgi:hypothetical protein
MNVLNFNASGRDSQTIPRVGYLARLHVSFTGSLNVVLGGGTAALDALGPWNAINRVRVAANAGQDIYSTSGYGCFLVNMAMMRPFPYQPDTSVISPALGYAARVFAAPTASGANVWDWGFTIPIAVNDESELGLILLQNDLAVTTFALEFNQVFSLTALQAPVLVTGAATATLTGVFTPTVEYFAVPAGGPALQPDITWLHQVIEFTQPIAAVGDNQINHIRDNTYLGIIYQMLLNNAQDTLDLDRLRFVANQSDTPYDFTNRALLRLQRLRYGHDLPVGVFYLDLFHNGVPAFAGERDTFNGRSVSELASILTINSGATIGSNPKFNYIQRQLVELTAPPVRVA